MVTEKSIVYVQRFHTRVGDIDKICGVLKLHITQGDHEGRAMIVSWVTMDEAGSDEVLYWKNNTEDKISQVGKMSTYKYYNYTSGYIHHCTIDNLEFNTTYYYEVGIGQSPRTFWFTTPPQPGLDVPYVFGIIGDLGQTYDSNTTLTHYENNPANGQILHMQIIILITITGDGIHGGDSPREVLHTSLGFGLLETMNSILPQKL